MIKRIISTPLPCIIYNPPKIVDEYYMRECHKAGALPIIDTEFLHSDFIMEILQKYSREEILFGVRLSSRDIELISFINNENIHNLDCIILSYNDPKDLSLVTDLNSDCKVIVEVTDIEILEELKKLAPHALIVKGNEAPGKVSRYTSLVLLQWYLENSTFPVFVHGGVGLYTSAGIFAAGAAGIVMDNQLYLTEEAPISKNFREVLGRLEDNDSVVLGKNLNRQYRFFSKLGTGIIKKLKTEESMLLKNVDGDEKLYSAIKNNFVALNDPSADPVQSLFYLGQDAVFARHMVRKSAKLRDVLHGLFKQIGKMLSEIDEHDPLRKDSRLAREHGTTYPIVQGPMANISDNTGFAKEVLSGGALPFFAMGNLPGEMGDSMLTSANEEVKKYGVGLIGLEAFNPNVEKHLEVVKRQKVPFALFAAGIPSRVRELEEEGTRTYLHTPSMQMLENAMQNDCRRFIFEGTEAGGHVGSLTSLVLWELAMVKLSDLGDEELKTISVLFAGGIGTSRASWFVSGIASELARRGAAVGIQVGTPYLFSKEIVETGALQKLYQELVCRGKETMVMGETVGLYSRSLPSHFSKKIIENEHQRIREGIPLKERKEAFELDNAGSLLIGAKGFRPVLNENNEVKLARFNDDQQLEMGNFMAGDCITCNESTVSIGDIHDSFVNFKSGLFRNLNALEIFSGEKNRIQDEIAIVGMGCIMPDAESPGELWQNIIGKKYSIGDIPSNRFDEKLYYSKDRKAEGKSYTKLAGVVRNFAFDHERYGYSAEEAEGMSRSQKMILEAAFRAIEDAGYGDSKGIPGDRSAVIIGTCLSSELNNDLHLKYHYPEIRYYLDQIDEFVSMDEKSKEQFLEGLKRGLAQGHSREFPDGAMNHIEASRIAKHLGIEGVSYTIDAACATSLAAVDAAMKELLSGSYDVIITGGINTNLAPESFVGFAKMGALSAEGSFPFDERSGGFILGEGAGVFVLKRMKDALRDGDEIHAVIKNIGSSSDGKGKAIAAPNHEGQKIALQRCFDGMHDDTTCEDIDYIEAHGTSTLMGDLVELQTLKGVYQTNSPVGISSIKSQIGHLLGGAGAAGLMKAVLAIQNKTLPPNGLFEKLSPRLDLIDSNLFIIKDPVSWEIREKQSRKSAISSFGFGGINYHCVIQEHNDNYRIVRRDIFSRPELDFNERRVVIAGMGVKLPGARSRDELWEVLKGEKSVLSAIPESRFHNSYYEREGDPVYNLPSLQAGIVDDSSIVSKNYRIPPATARVIDRAQFFALDAASQAIEEAGLKEELIAGNRTAVILGTMTGEKLLENIVSIRLPLIEKIVKDSCGEDKISGEKIAGSLGARLRERYEKATEDTVPGMLGNIISGRVANFFGCNGPNFIIDASSVSSAIAFDLSVKGLQWGEYDYVVTGGVDSNLSPLMMRAFNKFGLLADEQCRVFDRNSRGINMSEGAVVFVMTTLENARKRNMPILAEVSGVSMTGMQTKNLISPSESAYSQAINNFYDGSDIVKRQLDYIDIYGSSYPLFDRIEYQAINKNFSHHLSFGNSKPELGYYKSANPAVAMAKLMLMKEHRSIPANLNMKRESTIVKENSVLTIRDASLDMDDSSMIYLGANVFGVGGNHGHFVISTLPEWLRDKPVKESVGIEFRPDVMNSFIHQPHAVSGKNRGMVALLSGQGAQRSGMMKELYEENAFIRDVMTHGNIIFQEARGESLLEIMFSDNPAINSTDITQPAIFLSSAALYDYLCTEGLEPEFFIGHSLGECTALYCSGMLDFEDAMKLILKRSEFMKAASDKEAGRIMVIFKNREEVQMLIDNSKLANVYVSNMNSETQTAVAGGSGEIDAFCRYLKKKNIMFKLLNLSGAFHTPLLSQVAADFREYLSEIDFNDVNFSRIISNVTGKPYPDNEEKVKDLLAQQIISPVNFIDSIEYVSNAGATEFIEIGPGRLLLNLLNNISVDVSSATPAMDPKTGELESLMKMEKYFINRKENIEQVEQERRNKENEEDEIKTELLSVQPGNNDDDFRQFLMIKKDEINALLENEFRDYKRDEALKEIERFNFYTGPVVISGVAIGLPGMAHHVFNDNNFDRILKGENFIDPLSPDEKERMMDKNIIKVLKSSDGNARFVEITSSDEVIQLAGKLGYFSLDDYGIEYDHEITDALAMAAGIEALKDAGIPLVQSYKKTTTGGEIPNGFVLPDEMQDSTGIIFTSAFAGFETLIKQVTDYYHHRFLAEPYKEFKKIYYYLMEKITEEEIKEQLTQWFMKVQSGISEKEYSFDRTLLFKIICLGSAHLAQLIKAKGPNTHLRAACASTTQALGVAEDWIRIGRCERVIVVGGEASGGEIQGPWVQSGFLALGAATIKKTVQEAAKPFDEGRNGTIVGSGAVALIVEREDSVKSRGRRGQAELMGTYMGNSAFHATRIDVDHVAGEMKRAIEVIEDRHNLRKDEYTRSMVFMSHETYTPAKGGSASAEVMAIMNTFPQHYKNIVITNTKGFTGHTLGAGIEDAVLVKALQMSKVPPVANLTDVPDEFKELCFSRGEEGDYQYGMHFGAGFGSHFAFALFRKINEKDIIDNQEYNSWLQKISGAEVPRLTILNNMLCLQSDSAAAKVREVGKPAPAAEIKDEDRIGNKITSAVSSASLADTIKEIIADFTGYTRDMLEDDLDLEGDLGIDTVKQVEIFGAVSANFDLDVPDDLKLGDLNTIAKLSDYIGSRILSSAGVEVKASDTGGDAINVVKGIIADFTGYTLDMLEDDLDLEGDLGIDTVKQVEIFGAVSANFDLDVADDLQLGDLNTIAKLSDYIESRVPSSAGVEVKASDAGGDAADVVKGVIADFTGYTLDMLEDDLDLEGDLGIDTVKQVEIFGAVSAHFDLDVPDDLKLNDLNTIAKLVAYMEQDVGNTEKEVSVKEKKSEAVTLTQKDNDSIKSFSISIKKTTIPGYSDRTFKGKTFLVTRDSFGFADNIIRKITKLSGKVVTMGSDSDSDLMCSFQNLANLEKEVKNLENKYAHINGLIHCAPMDYYFNDREVDEEAINASVKSLFVIIKTLHKQLNVPGGIIAAPSIDSVVFPYAEVPLKSGPCFAGVAGMLKSVNKEFAETLVKAVDFSSCYSEKYRKEFAETFINELLSGDTTVEIGYRKGKRFTLSLNAHTPLMQESLITEGSRVLVTGGAGGITCEILKRLAEEYRPKFIILGRSRIDNIDEKFLPEEADEKFIIRHLKKTMDKEKPLEVRNTALRILRARTSRQNIESLRKLGADVEYHAVDVTDYKSVKKVIDGYESIDGIIHAAGLEESQLIEKKNKVSFDRVFDTKIYGAINLLKAAAKLDYSFFITFSSVAARFGNAGQSDYSASNDMLGKLILREKMFNSGRSYKVMDWTAWEGAGMATKETVKKVLQERGMSFLTLQRGIDFFMAELKDRRSLETLYTGFDHGFDSDKIFPEPGSPSCNAIVPFVDVMLEKEKDRVLYSRVLDIKRDLFLLDHSREGVPLFLGATGVEAMAEAASTIVSPGSILVEVENFSIPYGIKILQNKSREIIITANVEGSSKNKSHCSIISQFRNKEGRLMGDSSEHFRGTFNFSKKRPRSKTIDIPSFSPVECEGSIDELLYHPQRLFMDGLFRTVKDILSFDGNLLICRVNNFSSREFFSGIKDPDFKVDVIILDAMFQTGGVFEFLTSGDVILPSAIRKMSIFRKTVKEEDYLCLTRKVSESAGKKVFNIQLLDMQGNLYMEVADFEMVIVSSVPDEFQVKDRVMISV